MGGGGRAAVSLTDGTGGPGADSLLDSILPSLGQISTTSDMQMTPPLWQEVKKN